MGIPENELRLLLQDCLNCRDSELFKDTLVFSVAFRIVKYDDPDLLDKMPSWVEDGVCEMIQQYRINGSYKVISNLGEADHTELVKKLSEIMTQRKG